MNKNQTTAESTFIKLNKDHRIKREEKEKQAKFVSIPPYDCQSHLCQQMRDQHFQVLIPYQDLPANRI